MTAATVAFRRCSRLAVFGLPQQLGRAVTVVATACAPLRRKATATTVRRRSGPRRASSLAIFANRRARRGLSKGHRHDLRRRSFGRVLTARAERAAGMRSPGGRRTSDSSRPGPFDSSRPVRRVVHERPERLGRAVARASRRSGAQAAATTVTGRPNGWSRSKPLAASTAERPASLPLRATVGGTHDSTEARRSEAAYRRPR